MNVLCFFMNYRLYVDCNAKLTAELQVIINYKHKILQQCYSNTNFLSEDFLSQKSKELLKKNLVFRACLLAEFFLLKLNTAEHDHVFRTKLFPQRPYEKTYRRVHC